MMTYIADVLWAPDYVYFDIRSAENVRYPVRFESESSLSVP